MRILDFGFKKTESKDVGIEGVGMGVTCDWPALKGSSNAYSRSTAMMGMVTDERNGDSGPITAITGYRPAY